jgi:hypothetical protein
VESPRHFLKFQETIEQSNHLQRENTTLTTLIRIVIALPLVVFSVATAVPVSAATRLGVGVSLSGEDAPGKGLASAVREKIQRSESYQLVEDKKSDLQIRLVSLDVDGAGHPSAIAVAYTMTNSAALDEKNPQTWYPIYLTTYVFVVDTKNIDAVAKIVVASLDQQVEGYRLQIPH